MLSLLSTSLAALILIVYHREAINEIPDRWHLPYLNHDPVSSLKSPTDIFTIDPSQKPPAHPIDDLVKQAEAQFRNLLRKETHGVAHAVEAYTARRGRYPPPGFNEWVIYAEAHDSIMIEEFFDRIHHDLNPFWGVAAERVRGHAANSKGYIRIRDGKASRSQEKVPFVDSYFDMISQIAQYLPDMDIPFNHMDEPRILASFETVGRHMAEHDLSLRQQELSRPPMITNFPDVPQSAAQAKPASFAAYDFYWNLAREACDPSSQASSTTAESNYSAPPLFPRTYPFGTRDGFVKNYTTSQDVCVHPHLRYLHGTFVEPITMSISTELVPMFGGSKLLMNNDILLPAAVCWADEQDQRFTAGIHRYTWKDKRNEVFWRGTGSGGRNTAENWTRFQRHRLVSMLNGTQVEMALKSNTTDDGLPHNFPLPNDGLYPLTSQRQGLLADWVRSFSNVAFYWLECFPPTKHFSCSYTGPWYRRGRQVPMERMFKNKYLPDIDGNSFSGRFRAFLLSNSMPIKATIYTEWHDSRLIPWKHFAPMDNTFVDLWSILEYFFQRDATAETIGAAGREWAEKVLRKEDMLVYVYRLLLEYARVSHPNREEMGFYDAASRMKDF